MKNITLKETELKKITIYIPSYLWEEIGSIKPFEMKTSSFYLNLLKIGLMEELKK